MLEKVGGRKFAMALILIAVGAAIDLATERGLSQNLAWLLGGILVTFSTGNVVGKFPSVGSGNKLDISSISNAVKKAIPKPAPAGLDDSSKKLLIDIGENTLNSSKKLDGLKKLIVAVTSGEASA